MVLFDKKMSQKRKICVASRPHSLSDPVIHIVEENANVFCFAILENSRQLWNKWYFIYQTLWIIENEHITQKSHSMGPRTGRKIIFENLLELITLWHNHTLLINIFTFTDYLFQNTVRELQCIGLHHRLLHCTSLQWQMMKYSLHIVNGLTHLKSKSTTNCNAR